ncbi:MAG: hypothetical protein ACLQLT_10425 [Methylovirgula sp.]
MNQSKIMIETSNTSDVFKNVIDCKNLERDASGKPVPTFPHSALGTFGTVVGRRNSTVADKDEQMPPNLLDCVLRLHAATVYPHFGQAEILDGEHAR